MSVLTPVCFIDMSRGRPTRQRAAEDGNGQVPPQADPPVPGANGGAGVTHAEFRNVVTMLAQVVANQANQVNQGAALPPPPVINPASRIRDFQRINPPEFEGSKVDEDPMNF